MANQASFVEHVVDLLSPLGPVEVRKLFGGHGLYRRGLMFGLLDDDEVFFKTDDENRPRFVSAGCRMWQYPGADQTSYYRPPDEAHEDPEAMLPWATLGLAASLRHKAAKDAAAKAKATRAAEREAKKAKTSKASPAPTRKAARRKGARGRR